LRRTHDGGCCNVIPTETVGVRCRSTAAISRAMDLGGGDGDQSQLSSKIIGRWK
jgi:hypothetical protein